MDKLDNAKIFLIKTAIQKDKRITKEKIMPSINDGLIKDIGKYVRKHNQMPSLDDVMGKYRESEYFIDTMKLLNITIAEMEEMAKELLGMNIEGYQQPDKSTFPKIGRNEPCPCGSNKKYKKCCGSNRS